MSKMRHTRPAKWEQVRGLSFEFESPHTIPPHAHGWHQLIYAIRGVMTVRTPEGAWIVPPHRGVWVPADVKHSIQMSGRVSMKTLYVRPAIARSLPRCCTALDIPPLLRELILRATELKNLDKRAPAHVRLYGLIFDELRAIEAGALHIPQLRDRRALKIVKVFENDLADRRPLIELARAAGASKRTIERIFRTETGMGFSRWRQQFRFAHALRLLAAGAKVTTAAVDVGYDSPSAFVTAFRQVLGSTPGRYFGAAAPGKANRNSRRARGS